MQFTNSWFKNDAKPVWDNLIPKIKPVNILEIGSYEGASTCYLIATLSNQQKISITCVDSWAGGIEHKDVRMDAVEMRFDENVHEVITTAMFTPEIRKIKAFSFDGLVQLCAEGRKSTYDFIYIDGSHQAPDVLSDAVLAFELLKKDGFMVFDDYLWNEALAGGVDPIRSPKIAVDAFVNINIRKLRIIRGPLYQIFVQKII